MKKKEEENEKCLGVILLNIFQCLDCRPHNQRKGDHHIKSLKKVDNLDVIFLSSEPFPFQEKEYLEVQKMFENTKIILVDGECFSWYGTRLLYAFKYFKQLRNHLNSSFSI